MIALHRITEPGCDKPLSTIVDFEDVRIMIDCGLPYSNNISAYKSSHDLLSKIDLLIITGAEIDNCGALLYLINTYNYHVGLLEQNIYEFTHKISSKHRIYIADFLPTYR